MDSDPGVTTDTELDEGEKAARMLLHGLDDEGDIFFGPVTDKEKLKSKKMRRKTEVFKPGFRAGWDREEEEGSEEGMGEEPEEEVSLWVNTARESADDELINANDSNQTKYWDSDGITSESSASGSTEDSISSPGSEQSVEEVSKDDLKPNNGLFTQRTPSLAEKRLESSESAIHVNTPPFSVVAVSPQADAAVISSDNGDGGVELFNATECLSVPGYNSMLVGTDQDRSSSEQDMIHPSPKQEENEVESQCVETVDNNQMHCVDESSKRDFSEVKEIVDAENVCSAADRQTWPAPIAKPTLCKNTGQSAVIYSSPLLISTSAQRVQMQQPLCYGNGITHIPIPITINVNRVENVATESNYAHQMEERTVAPSSVHPTGHSAFAKPASMVGDMAASPQNTFPHSPSLLPTHGSFYPSPASNMGYCNQVTNNHQRYCTVPASMPHKENVNPERKTETVIVASDSATKYKVLSAVSSPRVSVLCSEQPSQSGLIDARQAPSPRVLQLSNRQTSTPASPSVARQRLLEEKRALLARLRAEKQELRQRIKEDNEKCFNMKLENAAALHSNMARGMTPLFDRLPSQGCDGRAALTLTDRELEMVTKLHTIKNSQHASSDRTQSPCHQAMRHRDQSRLHWHQDLIMNTEELSSPSRPRCTARTILSKKGHDSIRRGPGLQLSSSLHSGQPRAKQHLLF